MQFTFGPVLQENGVLFRFWAPVVQQVELIHDGNEPQPMEPAADGWFSLSLSGARAGDRYRFRLPDGLEVPDPASRHQPEDVHGASEVVDPDAYRWRVPDWKGRPAEELVLYELHVGAFTPEGTFEAAIGKLDHLAGLGVTGIQLMPIADFPGRYGWGYDGVLPYAPESSYGRPEQLKALVDAAHQRGICVFLDVVYNHLGPDGNYLPAYAPFFTERHKTPWGDGINYDGKGSGPIRSLVVENVLYWLTEFKVDGLRLDAVHAILDDSTEHLLHEIARRAREAVKDRPIHLFVENEDNDSSLLERAPGEAPQRFTAQWNDDVHHVLHIAATGETFGYYGDYAGNPDYLGKALAEGFVYQGEHMPYRGDARGKPSGHLPSTAFISFMQNHDQVGNRAKGDRMAATQSLETLKAIAAVYLLSPQIPMLFMGEEWGAPEPFPYFCDFNEELNEKVREGRKRELGRLPGFHEEDALDPTSVETFDMAKLDWERMRTGDHADMLTFYRHLLAVRREKVAPLLQRGFRGDEASHHSDGAVTQVHWRQDGRDCLTLVANLSGTAAETSLLPPEGEIGFEFGSRAGHRLSPWYVAFVLGG